MKNIMQTANIIRWIARIWGSLSIAFLLFMIGGHLFGNRDTILGGFNSNSEIVAFLCFPVSTLLGLIIAWKWEGLGGIITTVGIICFHLIMSDLFLIAWIDGLATPGLLFLIYWFLPGSRQATGAT